MRTRLSRPPSTGCRNLRSAAVLVFLVVAAQAQTTPVFDNSGNGTLNGTYFVRQVLAANVDPNSSAIGRAVSLTGTMTFDGNGNYKFSGQITDTLAGTSAAPYTVSGLYAAAANGLMQIQNPIDTSQIDYGGVGGIGPSAINASATESNGLYNDVFVAIPISSGTNSVQGSYQMGFIDFLQGNASEVRDGYFSLSASGSGSFSNTSVSGAMANQSSTPTTQSVSGITYTLSNGTGTLTFPSAG